MAAVLSEIVLDQNGPKWPKRPFCSKWPYSELDFSFECHSGDQNGPKWSVLVHFGLKRSILVHLGPPTVLWPFLTRKHRIYAIFFRKVCAKFCRLSCDMSQEPRQGFFVCSEKLVHMIYFVWLFSGGLSSADNSYLLEIWHKKSAESFFFRPKCFHGCPLGLSAPICFFPGFCRLI